MYCSHSAWFWLNRLQWSAHSAGFKCSIDSPGRCRGVLLLDMLPKRLWESHRHIVRNLFGSTHSNRLSVCWTSKISTYRFILASCVTCGWSIFDTQSTFIDFQQNQITNGAIFWWNTLLPFRRFNNGLKILSGRREIGLDLHPNPLLT